MIGVPLYLWFIFCELSWRDQAMQGSSDPAWLGIGAEPSGILYRHGLQLPDIPVIVINGSIRRKFAAVGTV